MQPLILIVDDDPTQRRLLEVVVTKQGYRTHSEGGGEAALEFLHSEAGAEVNLVLLDLVMPGMDGLTTLDKLQSGHAALPVIVLTAQAGIETVVRAMRAGATDFVVKPASPERLKVSIENGLKLESLAGQLSRLNRKSAGELGFTDLIAQSAAMRSVIDLAKRASTSNIPILIEGESGVGKELIARTIQGSGERAGKPFVVVNCGAIPENLVESLLFGHAKGAFTGAIDRHAGKFLEANGGTLFLDEIGELRLDMQVKLLRALQEGEIDPVGASRPVKVDIRLISATNHDLSQHVRDGKFREDLYYRLNVYPIHVPPLRERLDDISPLVQHFLIGFAGMERKRVRGVSPDAMQLLLAYHWPGNVRQLENAIFRAVVLCDGELLMPADFSQIAKDMDGNPIAAAVTRQAMPAVSEDRQFLDHDGHVRTLTDTEGDLIRLAIRKYHGRMSEVARRLGIGRSTLYRKVQELGITVREDRQLDLP